MAAVGMMSPTPKKKICSRCKKKKLLSEFCVRGDSKDGLSYWCGDCRKKYYRAEGRKEINRQASKKHHKTEKGKITQKRAAQKYHGTAKAKLKYRRKNLKNSYGLTLEQYDKMVEDQGEVCAICGEINVSGHRLLVDHDHKTGKVRGLLCYRCNFGMGFIDDENFVNRAKKYLKKHKKEKGE